MNIELVGQDAIAFVIKNQLPYQARLWLLHEKFGIIIVNFSHNKDAVVLTTGAFVVCQVQKHRNIFRLVSFDLISIPEKDVIFQVHTMMQICLKGVHFNVAVPELFDFFRYVYGVMHLFNQGSWSIVFLRLFVMCDFFVEHCDVYKIAYTDPVLFQKNDWVIIQQYLDQAWYQFYEKKVDPISFIR